MAITIYNNYITGLAYDGLTDNSVSVANFSDIAYYAGNNEGSTVGVNIFNRLPGNMVVIQGRHTIGQDTALIVLFPANLTYVYSAHINWGTSPDNTSDYWVPKVAGLSVSGVTVRNTNTYASFWFHFTVFGKLA